jgi:hypothetical protein
VKKIPISSGLFGLIVCLMCYPFPCFHQPFFQPYGEKIKIKIQNYDYEWKLCAFYHNATNSFRKEEFFTQFRDVPRKIKVPGVFSRDEKLSRCLKILKTPFGNVFESF